MPETTQEPRRANLHVAQPVVVCSRSSVEALDVMRMDVARRPPARGTEPVREGSFVVTRELGSWGTQDASALDRAVALPRPVHVLVPAGGGPKPTALLCPHKWKFRNPYDDLIPFDGGSPRILVAPPELALLQLAARLDRVHVAGLINQLVGTYRVIRPQAIPTYRRIPHSSIELYPRGSTEDTCISATVYGLKPLTTVERVRDYVRAMPSAHGSHLVEGALPLAHDGLASPLESQTYMLAFCSRRLGSLGLPMPDINGELPLTPQARRFANKDVIIPDFYWPEGHVALETNGWLYHGSPRAITGTSLRDKAYRAMGITCLTLTSPEVRSENLFMAAMEELAGYLGTSIPQGTEAFRRQRQRLRDQMFPPRNVPEPEPETDEGYLAQLDAYADSLAASGR